MTLSAATYAAHSRESLGREGGSYRWCVNILLLRLIGVSRRLLY